MSCPPLLQHFIRRLYVLEFVETITQHDQTSAFLILLGEVQNIELPIFLGEYFVGSILESAQIKNAEELAALNLVVVCWASIGKVLIGISRTFAVWVVWDLLGQKSTGEIGTWRGYSHFERLGRGSIGHAGRHALTRSKLAHARRLACRFSGKIWGKLSGALATRGGCAKQIAAADGGRDGLCWWVRAADE